MADEFDPYYTWLGIRPEEQPPDHYRLIGIRRFEENGDVIANAMDRQMQFLRSMQVGKRSAVSQRLLNEISAAGGCLLDPHRKTAYDQELREKDAARNKSAKTSRPLPKAAPLPAAPKPAPQAAPLPEPNPLSIPDVSAASPASPRKPAAASHLPRIVGGAVGGVAVLLLAVLVAGWMLSGGKTIAEKPPKADQGKPPVPASGAAPNHSPQAKAVAPKKKVECLRPAKQQAPAASPATPNSSQSFPVAVTHISPWLADTTQHDRLMTVALTAEGVIEFPGTAERLKLDHPVAAELWLQVMLEGDKPAEILGTRTAMPDSGSQPKGWALLARRSPGQPASTELVFEFWKPSGEVVRQSAPLENSATWHHVAFTLKPDGASQLFVDGKSVLSFPLEKDISAGPRDLKLGSGSSSAPPSYHAFICGFRVSEMPRYESGFVPPSPLEMQRDHLTLAMLDCQLHTHPGASWTADPARAWQYGIGKWDDQAKRISDFRPLTHASATQWQAAPDLPDPVLGWVALDPMGGLAGNDPQQATVRRWTAPADGIVKVSGRLWHVHEHGCGSGVHGRIVHSRSGSVGEWSVNYSDAPTEIKGVEVRAGDTLDFAVDRGADPLCDYFEWVVDLRLADSQGKALGAWNSAADFEAASGTAAAWQYGMGNYAADKQQVEGFQPLRFSTGQQWQAGAKRPDDQCGWICLDALGGSAGNSAEHSPVRRWTAPAKGAVTISGYLRHRHETREGDGVRGRITSTKHGRLGEWTVNFSEVRFLLDHVNVEAGETVDFMVENLADWKCDAFVWIVDVSLADASGKVIGAWNSAADFRAAPLPPAAIMVKGSHVQLAVPGQTVCSWLPLGTQQAALNGWTKESLAVGKFTTPPAAEAVPSSAATPPEDARPADAPPAERVAAGTKKLPIPPAAAVSEARKQVASVFADDLKGAKTPKAKQDLGKKMLDLAKTTSDLTTRFSLLEEARRMAVEAKDPALGLSALDAQAADFEMDLVASKIKLLENLAGEGLVPAQRGLVLTAACNVGNEALEADQMEAVQAISVLVRSLVAKSVPPEAKAGAKEFLDAATQRQKRGEAVRRAEQTLATSPDDPAANLILGLHHCFTRGDFSKGLPLLAKGNNPKLAAVAKLQQPNAKLAQVEVTSAKSVNLTSDSGWSKVPPFLKGAKIYCDSPTGRELQADIKSDGVVFVAASWTYDGNSGGGWAETRTLPEQMSQGGWKPLGEMVWKDKDSHQLYFREWKAGERIAFHTRKYNQPFLILPDPALVGPQISQSSASLEETDAWYDAIATVPTEYKPDVQRKALAGYTVLATSGIGLVKAKAEKRRQELSAEVTAAPAKTAKRFRPSDLPERTPGMVGRVLVDGKDSGILITYRPPGEMNREQLLEVLAQTKAKQVRLMLSGTVSCPAPCDFRVYQWGKEGGPVQVVAVNGKQVNTAGGSSPSGSDEYFAIAAGDHVVQWICDYDGTAAPRLDLFFETDGGEQPVRPHSTRAQEYDARKIAPRAEIDLSPQGRNAQ